MHFFCTGEITILALRRKNNKTVPFVALEIQENSMNGLALLRVRGWLNEEEIIRWILSYCQDIR